MSARVRRLVLLGFATAAAGCGAATPTGPAAGTTTGLPDPDSLRAADTRILYVGNSHTASHDLPGLVRELIRFRHPGRTVYSHHVFVAFLENTADLPGFRDEVEPLPWTHVVLQAQKISMSGKHEYPRDVGIALAKRAKDRGADVVFYPEWGLRGVPGDGQRQERVYREMAGDAGVRVAPVARAWDLALAARPDLPLHADDGNHQTRVGAFLTACVLYGLLTGDDPAALADYPDPVVPEVDRRFLAGIAAQAVADEKPNGVKP